MSEVSKATFTIGMVMNYAGKIAAVNIVVNGVGMGAAATAAPGDSVDINVQLSDLLLTSGQQYKIATTIMDAAGVVVAGTPTVIGPITNNGWFLTLQAWKMPNFSVWGVIDLWPYP